MRFKLTRDIPGDKFEIEFRQDDKSIKYSYQLILDLRALQGFDPFELFKEIFNTEIEFCKYDIMTVAEAEYLQKLFYMTEEELWEEYNGKESTPPR